MLMIVKEKKAMKTLTKIKLINWHIFQNETILIKGNALIFGENGCGKSTLIDAIHYVIDGGHNVKFNSAANANNKNKRTVESYMRLKTGIEGKEYIRNGGVISHIALEFYDTLSKESSVIGVCLELVKGNKTAVERFYQLLRTKIDDSLYLNKDESNNLKVNNFADFSKIVNDKNIKINIFDGSKRDNCARIHRALSLYNDSSSTYSELLNKAISFKPIDNVNEFVYSYLMPEKDIDLNNLIASIRSYREIKKLVELEEEKKEILDKIIVKGDEYEQLKDKKICYNLVLAQRKKVFAEKRYKEKKQELNILSSEIENLSKIIELENNEKTNLIKTRTAYENDNLNTHYRNLLDQRERTKIELKNLENKLNIFNAKLNADLQIIKYFGIDINLNKFKNSGDLQGYLVEIANYKQILKEDLEPSLKERKLELDRIFQDETSRKNELLKTKENLENYQTDYKKDIGIDINSFVDLVKNKFHEEYRKDIEIGPLCSYIEIKNEYENKRNLLEQFLANRRFDIIVNGRYFNFVSKIYNENKDKFESLSLIDLNKYPDEVEVKENSLYNYFEFNSVDAEKYCKLILGNAFEKENFQAFSFENEEITNDGFAYLKNKLIQRAKKTVKLPYIGVNSFKERLQKCLSDIEIVNERINNIRNNLNEIKEKLDLISKSNIDYLCLDGVFVYPEFSKKSESLKELEKEIESLLKENQDLATLANKIKECDEKIAEKDRLIVKLNDENSSKKAKKEGVLILIDELTKQTDEANIELDEINENPRIDLIRVAYFVPFSNLSNELILKELRIIDNQVITLENSICDSMKEYNLKIGETFPAKIESLKDFKDLYNKTIRNTLSKYKSQLDEAENKAINGFKVDYISKIRKSIQDEHDHINKLNKVLKSKPFGTDGDVYEFIIQRNKNEQLGRFYDIFMSNEDFEPRDLFSNKLNKKDEEALLELFKVFTDENNNSSDKERKLKEYTDYRSFMSYDIKIRYSNNEIAYFSKVSNEKSGGETQTPFYIIIAASFEQLFNASSQFNKRETPLGLVILDEAFNNMDEQRIEAMISYFKTLNEQFLVVVPSQRASIMMSYFDTTIALVKRNNRAILLEDLHKND